MADLENTNGSARSADTGSKLVTLGQVKNAYDDNKRAISALKTDLVNVPHNDIIITLDPSTFEMDKQIHGTYGSISARTGTAVTDYIEIPKDIIKIMWDFGKFRENQKAGFKFFLYDEKLCIMSKQSKKKYSILKIIS